MTLFGYSTHKQKKCIYERVIKETSHLIFRNNINGSKDRFGCVGAGQRGIYGRN